MKLYEIIELQNDLKFEILLIAPFHLISENIIHKKRIENLIDYFENYLTLIQSKLQQKLRQKQEDIFRDLQSTCMDSIHILSICLKIHSEFQTQFGIMYKLQQDLGQQEIQNIKQILNGKKELDYKYESYIKIIQQLKKLTKYDNIQQIIPKEQDIKRNCEGYISLIRNKENEILMTMTIWTNSNLDNQEHALIMKNIFVTNKSIRFPEPLSIMMHSFAASSINKSIIYCSPFQKMKQMLIKTLKKYKINFKVHNRIDIKMEYHPCRFFGTDLTIENVTNFKNIFQHYCKKIKIKKIRYSSNIFLKSQQSTKQQNMDEID